MTDETTPDENDPDFLSNLLVEEDNAEHSGELSDAAFQSANNGNASAGAEPPTFGTPNHRATKKPLLTSLRGGKAGSKTKTPKVKASVPRRQGMFVKPLTNLYTSIGIGLMAVDQQCGETVIKSAEQCAKSLDDLAYQNESVRRALYALIQTSAAGAVVIAHMPILVSVMLHHMPGVSSRFANVNLNQFSAEDNSTDA